MPALSCTRALPANPYLHACLGSGGVQSSSGSRTAGPAQLGIWGGHCVVGANRIIQTSFLSWVRPDKSQSQLLQIHAMSPCSCLYPPFSLQLLPRRLLDSDQQPWHPQERYRTPSKHCHPLPSQGSQGVLTWVPGGGRQSQAAWLCLVFLLAPLHPASSSRAAAAHLPRLPTPWASRSVLGLAQDLAVSLPRGHGTCLHGCLFAFGSEQPGRGR